MGFKCINIRTPIGFRWCVKFLQAFLAWLNVPQMNAAENDPIKESLLSENILKTNNVHRDKEPLSRQVVL